MVRDTGAQPLGQGLEGPATRQGGGARAVVPWELRGGSVSRGGGPGRDSERSSGFRLKIHYLMGNDSVVNKKPPLTYFKLCVAL